MLNIKIENYAEAMEIISELPQEMQRLVFLPALKKSSKSMLVAAKNRAPKDSGALAKSLKITSERRWKHTLTEVGIKPVFRRFSATTENQYYGAMVIGGTAERVPKKGKMLAFADKSGKMIFTPKAKALPARPFIEESFNATANQVGAAFEKEVIAATEKFINKNFI